MSDTNHPRYREWIADKSDSARNPNPVSGTDWLDFGDWLKKKEATRKNQFDHIVLDFKKVKTYGNSPVSYANEAIRNISNLEKNMLSKVFKTTTSLGDLSPDSLTYATSDHTRPTDT